MMILMKVTTFHFKQLFPLKCSRVENGKTYSTGGNSFPSGFLFQILLVLFLVYTIPIRASKILIPMDADTQENHLKAYGITYWLLGQQKKVQWLLNYRGGSFLVADSEQVRKECLIRGVSFELISDAKATEILDGISSPSQNQEAVLLEKAPKIAVYSPEGNKPWDDAVTMVLTYAEIPYETIYDREVLNDALLHFDWLHLHHEDFTGQYGKFYRAYRTAPWYIEEKQQAEALAAELGYDKVSEEKLAVALKIRDFVVGGGFMFAMCSATDSFDIALAAAGVDIAEAMFDGDPSDPNYQSLLNFENTFAFSGFLLERDPMVYEFSSIDMTNKRFVPMESDYFSLMEFSAKWDPIPTMLTQNHTMLIKGFMGQTTAYDPEAVKPTVMVLGKTAFNGEAKYIHGIKGRGFFTFYGGHDPEDYQHMVGDPKTELELHPTSPGYRLILNNILLPAARKKEQKT